MPSFEIDIIPVLFELNDIPFHEEDFENFQKKYEEYNSFAEDEDLSTFTNWELCYKVNDNFYLSARLNPSSSNKNGKLELDKTTVGHLGENATDVYKREVDARDLFLINQSIYFPELIYDVLPTEDLRDIEKLYKDHHIRYGDSKISPITSKLSKQTFIDNIRGVLSVESEESKSFLGDISKKVDRKFEIYQMVYDNGTLSKLDDSYNYQSHPNSIGIISRVFEFNNRRLAELRFSGKNPRLYRNLIVVGHKHELYNYLDIGRKALVYDSNTTSYGISRARERKFCLGLFHQMDPQLPKEQLLRDLISEEYTNKQNEIIDAEDVNEDATSLLIARQEEEQRQKKEEVISNKIRDRAQKLDQKEVTINDVTFRENEIEYEDQLLKILSSDRDNSSWVSDILTSLASVYSHDQINFDRVLPRFLKKVGEDTDIEAIIGDVKAHRVIKTIEHKNGRKQSLHYINDARINKDEVVDCLERALCYTDDEDYKNFLDKVSKCSLKYHRYLHNGLDFRVRDPLKSNSYNIKIPLERRKNINYLDINNNLYRVSNSNKIINATGYIDLDDLRKIITDDDVVNGVNLEDLVPILKEGKQEYIDAVEKSRELIEQTEELFDLSVDVHELNQSDDVKGYKIKGDMREYVVSYDPAIDIDQQSHNVYEYPSGRYICIVDKSTDQVGYDKLVNRIYALHNDKLVAPKISTLK